MQIIYQLALLQIGEDKYTKFAVGPLCELGSKLPHILIKNSINNNKNSNIKLEANTNRKKCSAILIKKTKKDKNLFTKIAFSNLLWPCGSVT